MASRFSNGDYVAQIFSYEEDILRLLRDLQLHVAAGHAVYAAVMLCRFSGRSTAIEKDAIIAAAGSGPTIDQDQNADASSTSASDAAVRQARDHLRGDLILTLLHVDTTWRFDSFENRLASPKLSWPIIRQLFTRGNSLGVDLILRRQYYHIEAPVNIPYPPAHVLHVEINCSSKSNAVVSDITRKLRQKLQFWTRQLLFESDPATTKPPEGSVSYVLVQEFDTRHTAESLAASLDSQSLRQLADENIAQALIRILTMEGSATYHNMTPQDPDEMETDLRTHDEAIGVRSPGEPYWGISPKSYVDF